MRLSFLFAPSTQWRWIAFKCKGGTLGMKKKKKKTLSQGETNESIDLNRGHKSSVDWWKMREATPGVQVHKCWLLHHANSPSDWAHWEQHFTHLTYLTNTLDRRGDFIKWAWTLSICPFAWWIDRGQPFDKTIRREVRKIIASSSVALYQ